MFTPCLRGTLYTKIMKTPDTSPLGRYVAAATALTLVFSSAIALFSLTPLHAQFSLGLHDWVIKGLLLGGLLIITFMGRPRLIGLRRTLGVIAAISLLYAVSGAYLAQIALGDTVLLFFGALIATIESLEPTLSSNEPADVFSLLSDSRAHL